MILPRSRWRCAFTWMVVAACLAASAAPLAAAVRYVSPAGNDASTGATPANAWKTISKANSSLAAGDVCVIAPGTYAHAINPANTGTPSARITYVGDLGNPAAVIVPEIRLTKSYVSVKGVKSNDQAILLYPARNDSVAYCEMPGFRMYAAKYSMVARNRITGPILLVANDGRACFTGTTPDPGCMANSEYDTIRANVVTFPPLKPSQRSFQMRGFTQQCLVDSNRFTASFDATGSTLAEETFALILYNSYYVTFRDNHWTFEALTAPPTVNTQWESFRLRDSTHHVTFERDTMLIGLNSQHPIRTLLASSGSFVHSVRANRFNQCYIKTNSYIYNQDELVGWTFENSVFAAKTGNVLWFSGFYRDNVLKNNLFYGTGQTVHFKTIQGTQNQITGNIFYSSNAQSPGNNGGQIYFEKDNTGFVSNHNVFFSPTFNSTPGDRSILWCCYGSSRPGTGTSWFNLNGQDGNSRYGSPRLADSTFAGLNPRLLAGSAAIGAGPGGTNAGPFSAPDDVPPAAIADLTATLVLDNAIEVRWSAPGDDGLTGTAAAYDLRWSTTPITDASFGAATQATAPAVAGPGGVQTRFFPALTPGTPYFFAIKTRDEAGNWSGLSNVLSATTAATDVVAPAATTDLSTNP